MPSNSVISLDELGKRNVSVAGEKGANPGEIIKIGISVYNRALPEGGDAILPMTDAFWGDRYGQLKDPYGHIWSIATHKKDVSPEEMEKAAKEAFSKVLIPLLEW